MNDVTSRIQADRNPKDVETLDLLRRRIQSRAWHRRTSEADLLLGGFVDRCVHSLTSAELRMLDRLLEVDDPIIEDWSLGRRATRAEYDTGVLEAFLSRVDPPRRKL